jgi:hypothetical protein
MAKQAKTTTFKYDVTFTVTTSAKVATTALKAAVENELNYVGDNLQDGDGENDVKIGKVKVAKA